MKISISNTIAIGHSWRLRPLLCHLGAATCDEASQICVCSGACPDFVKSWTVYIPPPTSDSPCVAANNTNANVDEEGDNIVIDGESFNPPFEACPGSTTSDGSVSSGMANKSFIAAVAVVGGAVMTFFG